VKLYGISPDYTLSGARVAIVGNSPGLLGRGFGEYIDSHDEVMRFNGAVTGGYEADVGKKTSICCVGIDIAYIYTKPFTHPGEHAEGNTDATRDRVRSMNADTFLQLFPAAAFFLFEPQPNQSWKIGGHFIPEAVRKAGASNPLHYFSTAGECFLDSADSTNRKLQGLGLITRMQFGGPRTGFKMVLRLLLSGVRPTLFGFDVDPKISTAEHYYDSITKENLDTYKDHDIRSERDAIAEMARLGLVTLAG
jgi:Glycosyltransferase family 29 (sialyltransferase)